MVNESLGQKILLVPGRFVTSHQVQFKFSAKNRPSRDDISSILVVLAADGLGVVNGDILFKRKNPTPALLNKYGVLPQKYEEYFEGEPKGLFQRQVTRLSAQFSDSLRECVVTKKTVKKESG